MNRIASASGLHDFHEQALEWERELAAGPTRAHAVTKQLLSIGLDYSSRQADEYVAELAARLFATRDLRHAVDNPPYPEQRPDHVAARRTGVQGPLIEAV